MSVKVGVFYCSPARYNILLPWRFINSAYLSKNELLVHPPSPTQKMRVGSQASPIKFRHTPVGSMESNFALLASPLRSIFNPTLNYKRIEKLFLILTERFKYSSRELEAAPKRIEKVFSA